MDIFVCSKTITATVNPIASSNKGAFLIICCVWSLKVCKLEKEIEWFYKKDGSPKDMNFDMADSYVVSTAGLITLGIISKEDWKKRYLSI